MAYSDLEFVGGVGGIGSPIREAIDRCVQLGMNDRKHEIVGIGDEDYYWNGDTLELIDPPRYNPSRIRVGSLDSLSKLIKAELGAVHHPIFVEVESNTKVIAYTTYGDRFERQYLYEAISDVPGLRFDWKDYESAMIAFRSQFAQDEGVAYVLDLLSKITDENSVKQEDNGLAQTVEVKRGVSLKAVEHVKPIVKLRPYRTFLEVEQPASEFLLRLQEGGQVGLFEADGGMWKLAAKDNIAGYLSGEFADMPDVIVMR